MKDDLNEKYFEAKRKHKASYNKRGYIVWIVVGLGTLSFFVGQEIIQNQRIKERKEETTREFIEQGAISDTDTVFVSKLTGTEILVLENCIYKEFNDTFACVKNDSSGLTYLTKRMISDADFPSSIRQWEKSIKSTDPTYNFSNLTKDSVDNAFFEAAHITLKSSGDKDMRGIIKMTRKGGLIYMLQIVSYTSTWGTLSNEIERIEQSFNIRE